MKVKITTAYPSGSENPVNIAAKWINESAQLDPFQEHKVTTDEAEADLILFMESHPGDDFYFEKVLTHPLRKQFPAKTFLYHDSDFCYPGMPGVYPSLPLKYQNPNLCLSSWYMARIEENKAVQYNPDRNTNDYLYSFIGANNQSARNNILSLKHPKQFLRDTTGKHSWTLSPEERQKYEAEYADVCYRSEFILCPAGVGPSSYRLFETMELGKCPVILSDQWTPPPFIDWKSCSLQIPEKDWQRIPEILESESGKEYGAKARRMWEQYMDKPVCFHWLVESCRQIMERNQHVQAMRMPYLRILRSDFRPLYVRSKLRQLKRRLLARA